MKISHSFRRSALLALALGMASTTAIFADSTTTTPPATPPVATTGEKHHHQHLLSADEKAQLKKAHDAALVADPTLQTEKDSLKQKFAALKAQGANASKDDWAALKTEHKDFKAKMRAAELKADPTLAPVFAKLDAGHKHFHHSTT